MWEDVIADRGVLLSRAETDVLAGYANHKCAVCGEKFRAGGSYAYKHTQGGRQVFFCRYNHMRQWEREKGMTGPIGARKGKLDEKYARQEARREAYERERARRQLNAARERVQTCERKVAYWSGIANAPETGEARRYKARESVISWENRLEAERKTLRTLEGGRA